jgi:predicted phosphoadenosine phosphosulfate sulfurtransferase
MEDSITVDQDAASRFWDRYINILAEQGVKENIRRWYVKRVEQYIRYYPDERLRSHSSRHIEQYFMDLGRDGRLADWQIRQTVDAIRILFCDLLHSDPVPQSTGITGPRPPPA